MPTKLFLELSEEKRAKIIAVSVAEFSEYGYANGSTNRIVQGAGISKGSLFKYFQNKNELYFYILDLAVGEMTESLAREAHTLSKELFERIVQYSAMEFAWYVEHPEKYRLITAAFAKNGGAIDQEVEARYGEKGRAIYNGLWADVDASGLRADKSKATDMVKWFLKGFNEDFVAGVQARQDRSADGVGSAYMESLREYLELLKSGLMAPEKGG